MNFLEAITKAGFTHFDDRAYILYRENIFTDKTKYIECLEADGLAKTMLAKRRLYQPYVASSVLITNADFDGYMKGPREIIENAKRDETLNKRVEELVELLGRFGKKGVVINDDLPEFQRLMADTIEINDKTDDTVISSKGATPADVKSITNGAFDVGLKRLVDAGYLSFACYHLTRSLPGIQSYDGAEAMLLSGKPTDSEKKQTIGLRLFFEADRVVKMIVTQRLVPALRASVSNCSL